MDEIRSQSDARYARGLARSWLAGLVAALCCWFLAGGVALAHPQLDEAKRLMGELEFEAALEAFDRALSTGGLSPDELVELLAERTLALHALHRESALMSDFVWLAAIAPEFILDMRAPPDLVAVWKSVRDQSRGPLQLRLAPELIGGTLNVRAELSGTVPDGVKTRIGLRQAGTETWEEVETNEVSRSYAVGSEVTLYAEAIGLGGLVVARDGSREAPLKLRIEPETPSSRLLADPGADRTPADKRKRRALWIGGSAALVAVAGVLTAVLVVKSRRDAEDHVDLMPMVTF